MSNNVINTSNVFTKSNVKLVLVNKLAEKIKWVERFYKSYTGSMVAINEQMFSDGCKFLIAVENGKELGYIRIANFSNEYEKFGKTNIWSITEAYVKPCYRNNGLLSEMIKQVVENYNVKVIRIETERLKQNYYYYKTLGFTYSYTVQGGELALAFQTDIVDTVKLRNAYYAALENEEYGIAA